MRDSQGNALEIGDKVRAVPSGEALIITSLYENDALYGPCVQTRDSRGCYKIKHPPEIIKKV